MSLLFLRARSSQADQSETSLRATDASRLARSILIGSSSPCVRLLCTHTRIIIIRTRKMKHTDCTYLTTCAHTVKQSEDFQQIATHCKHGHCGLNYLSDFIRMWTYWRMVSKRQWLVAPAAAFWFAGFLFSCRTLQTCSRSHTETELQQAAWFSFSLNEACN